MLRKPHLKTAPHKAQKAVLEQAGQMKPHRYDQTSRPEKAVESGRIGPRKRRPEEAGQLGRKTHVLLLQEVRQR